MTTFTVGEQVRSRVDAQGMKRGETFKVVEVRECRTVFGTFVTVVVKNPRTQETRAVVNSHLVMERV
jgi:hypothetical protein